MNWLLNFVYFFFQRNATLHEAIGLKKGEEDAFFNWSFGIPFNEGMHLFTDLVKAWNKNHGYIRTFYIADRFVPAMKEMVCIWRDYRGKDISKFNPGESLNISPSLLLTAAKLNAVAQNRFL